MARTDTFQMKYKWPNEDTNRGKKCSRDGAIAQQVKLLLCKPEDLHLSQKGDAAPVIPVLLWQVPGSTHTHRKYIQKHAHTKIPPTHENEKRKSDELRIWANWHMMITAREQINYKNKRRISLRTHGKDQGVRNGEENKAHGIQIWQFSILKKKKAYVRRGH